ncbi:MAG: ATPase domain-containing protein [Polyangiales bacterium]
MSNEARVCSSGIYGLDIVLGGGLRFIERVPGAGASAAILVRGVAGTGKTLLAMHIAAAVAKSLQGDVAVACVELLPQELQAQLSGFEATRPMLPVRVADELATDDSPRVFARVVLPDVARTEDPIGDEVVRLLEWVARCGGDPRVLVVDSLSDGYGLGGKIARPAADALAKLAAQRGLCLVLVEEVQRLVPSPWCFAVDTVLELRLAGFPDRTRDDRSLSVTKHRFGSSDAGPHELALVNARVSVLPDPEAWDRALAGGWWRLPVTATEPINSWGVTELTAEWGKKQLADYRTSTTRILADAPGSARRCARLLGAPDESGVLEIDLGAESSSLSGALHGSMIASPHRLLTAMIEHLQVRSKSVSKVVVGDLSVLRGAENENALRRSLAQLARWLRGTRIPVVFYETAASRLTNRVATDHEDHRVIEVQDGWSPEGDVGETVRIEIVSASVLRQGQTIYSEPPPLVLVHDLASGHRFPWRSLTL